MENRRSFLRKGTAAITGSVAAAFVGPSLPFSVGPLATALAGRLFFDDAEIDRFRSLYAGEGYRALRESIEGIDRAAERRFLSDELRYNDHLYDLPRTSKLAMNMAFHYLLTGDEDAAELAATCVETIQRFPKWDYFLEAGDRTFGLQRAPEATVATSLCWEWLADVVDEDTRNGWLRTMGDRGCEASWLGLYGMRYPDRVVGWTMDESSTYFEHRPDDRVDLSNWPHILDRTNLKAVPASATWAMRRAVAESGTDRAGMSPDDVFTPVPAFNPFLDLLDYARLIATRPRTGILTIGGGVPRNWAQQVAPFYDITNHRVGTRLDAPRFHYGVRLCPEPVHWGGLSGCTYSEGVSWGKFVPPSEGGRFAEVPADATIALPLLAKALFEVLDAE